MDETVRPTNKPERHSPTVPPAIRIPVTLAREGLRAGTSWMDALTGWLRSAVAHLWVAATRTYALTLVELTLVVLCGLAFTSAYLDMNSVMLPLGREFPSTIQLHYAWIDLQECGTCAFWYGGVRGGFPTLADPTASVLHPLVVVTTLIWGVTNGAKVALVGAFILAGLAQWWFGQALGLGRAARVWSACMVIVAGHLAARMELGAFNLIISVASCGLVLAPLLLLIRSGSLRMALVLGGVLAMVGVSGVGYMPIGLTLTLPAALIIWPWERGRAYSLLLVRRFVLALGIALLLAAPLLVPFAHFLPNFGKDFDMSFAAAQPFAFVPLNLIINDNGFYGSDVLQKAPFASHYANYVGWLPVLLALWGLFGARSVAELRTAGFLAGMAILALWVASAEPLRLLIDLVPMQRFDQLLAGIRFTSFISSLAVPPLLALAALAADRVLRSEHGLVDVTAALRSGKTLRQTLDLRWLALVPLIGALLAAWNYNGQWIGVASLPGHVPVVLDELATPDLQWVDLPIGEHIFVNMAIGAGYKISNDTFRTWRWYTRPVPEPKLIAMHGATPAGMQPVANIGSLVISAALPGREYAQVVHPDEGSTICRAEGTGGAIDVVCDLAQPGVLTVRENNWSGWHAAVNGVPAALATTDWLQTELPAGKHLVELRYQPWDVPLGAALHLVGVVLVIVLWRFGGDRAQIGGSGDGAGRGSQPTDQRPDDQPLDEQPLKDEDSR